ncbi:hypothetical protein JVU11DRAFT_7795 [Chiua virens]|nr:hypothetical protein JVU11DRAFT_7795 [Chiua virens]
MMPPIPVRYHNHNQSHIHIHSLLLQAIDSLSDLAQIMVNYVGQNAPQDATEDGVAENPQDATKCHWRVVEVEALISFKDVSFTGAAEHLQGFHIAGSKRKEGKHVKTKWNLLKAQYTAIAKYRHKSGFSWDDVHGANIQGKEAEKVWKEYISQNRSNAAVKPFKKKSFPLLNLMEEIYPEEVIARGENVFHLGQDGAALQLPGGVTATACGMMLSDTGLGGLSPIMMDVSAPASPAPLSSTRSTSNKRPLSTVSPDSTTSPSLLFSPPALASVSTYSINPPSTVSRSSKRSHLSAGGRDNNLNRTLDVPSITMVTSSIANLTDTVWSSFCDKLTVITQAMQQLYSLELAPSPEQILAIGEYFAEPENEGKAQLFLNFQAAQHVAYAKKLSVMLGVLSD